MTQDEQAIRELVSSWLVATSAWDIDHVSELMADDVVFLRCGQPPIVGRAEFISAQDTLNQFKLESRSDIQEVRVFGDWAYSWNKLSITLTPTAGGAPLKRSGHILSVLRKQADGQWVIFRDANTITTEKPARS